MTYQYLQLCRPPVADTATTFSGDPVGYRPARKSTPPADPKESMEQTTPGTQTQSSFLNTLPR